jgi:hypothetical protein
MKTRPVHDKYTYWLEKISHANDAALGCMGGIMFGIFVILLQTYVKIAEAVDLYLKLNGG